MNTNNNSINKNILSIINIAPKYINYVTTYEYVNFKKEINILISNRYLYNILNILKNNTNILLKQLIDIICVDFPDRFNRFELNYSLLSIKYNTRLNIKTYIDEITSINSLSKLFPNAVWSEREVWDLYGVLFINNPDLRRILTDYGFEGHPLRKDFPLTGYTELLYDDSLKNITYQQVNVAQQFRSFDYRSAW
jgi:NADH/F420H2 dehydrogenase subunit C